MLGAGAVSALGPLARRDAQRLVGSRWEESASPGELSGRLPRAAAKALEGVAQAGELWRAEARWWSNLETSGATMAGALDARRVLERGSRGPLRRGRLAHTCGASGAARGGGEIEELLDAVA